MTVTPLANSIPCGLWRLVSLLTFLIAYVVFNNGNVTADGITTEICWAKDRTVERRTGGAFRETQNSHRRVRWDFSFARDHAA
jgi:hypothetical protein